MSWLLPFLFEYLPKNQFASKFIAQSCKICHLLIFSHSCAGWCFSFPLRSRTIKMYLHTWSKVLLLLPPGAEGVTPKYKQHAVCFPPNHSAAPWLWKQWHMLWWLWVCLMTCFQSPSSKRSGIAHPWNCDGCLVFPSFHSRVAQVAGKDASLPCWHKCCLRCKALCKCFPKSLRKDCRWFLSWVVMPQ